MQRHFGIASENYTQYAVERLEVCVVNVRDLRYHLTHRGATDEELRVIIEQYDTQLRELLHCMEGLYVMWLEYFDKLLVQQHMVPRLCITRGQLEYLKSLAFTWSEIATILGVLAYDFV